MPFSVLFPTQNDLCILFMKKEKVLTISQDLEAPPGFEPGVEVLQTFALPLGHGAIFNLFKYTTFL